MNNPKTAMSGRDFGSERVYSYFSAYCWTIATTSVKYWETLDRGWKALAAALVVLTVTLADIPIGW